MVLQVYFGSKLDGLRATERERGIKPVMETSSQNLFLLLIAKLLKLAHC